MGISRVHGGLQLLQDVIRQERIVLSGLRMAELGNQYFRDDVLGCEVSAKLVFGAMGVDHISFDSNGKDGTIDLDLSKPLIDDYHERFDIVTNFGTSEHVENSQYWCWRNINDLCRPGGHMIHAIPEIGSWPRHGRWHYDVGRVVKLAAFLTYRMCLVGHHEHTHSDGRPQNSLLLCFRKSETMGSMFATEDYFQSTMFPPGQPHL